MASSSKQPSGGPSASATPAPSSPPPSESFFSELDGTAPSILDTSGEFQWDVGTSGHGLNLVSWKKGVEETEEEAGKDKRGFYAISTVLNHPTKKANPLRGTRKPLPPLGPAPPIPKPPSATHFDSYLKTVTPLYDTLLRTRAAADASPADVLTGAFDKQAPAPADLPPLASVPELFFSKEFDLANPTIWSQVVEAGPSRSGPSTSVHDHLSSHLDTLERHLIHEITLRSTSFFSALSNLQDLHSESASCLRRISDLQTGLREVGSQQARKGLTILDRMEDLRVLRVTERGMGELREAEEVMAVARSLVESGDWAGALGCVSDVARWWEAHRPNEEDEPPDPSEDHYSDHPLPLSTLPALWPLPISVSDLTTQIALQLEAALQSYLFSTLSSAELDVPYDKERFRDHVVPIVEGLVRCGAGDAVEGVWREVVTLAVREGSRKHLPAAQAEDDGHEVVEQEMRGATLASALKSMDHSRYLLLASQMYKSILARLRLAQLISPDLSSILSASSNLPPLRIPPTIPSAEDTEEETSPLSIDEAEIIAAACELGNLRASKILAVRGEQHAGLGINEFVELFRENWDFVLATEVLAQRMIASLRSVTASQARTFLIAYHSQRLTKSAKLVEEEQWNQIDVTSTMQHSVNTLIESAVSDPPECFIPPRQSIANGHSDAALSKTLDVEETKFFVVRATAESIGLLADYLGVVINLEVVVTDVMGRIIEFLKSFNSRTCQVVLGAGAMRSAGLKNITAKHLALASQSLSVIVALIPYIREFIRRHLSVKQAVMLTEFDKLKRDYQEHQNEIHAKLVAIMSDRLAVHVGSLRDIDWEATPEKDGPRAYAELLVKETATLHKVLGKYLSVSTVESVMSEVLAAIIHRLSEEYSRIEIKSEDAKKRLMQDTALITARLTPLAEAGKTVSSLEVLVKDKPVPRKNIIGNLLKRGGKKGEGGAVVADGQADGADEEEYDDGDDEGQPEINGGEVQPEVTAQSAEVSDGLAVLVKLEEKSDETPRESIENEAEPEVSTVATSVAESADVAEFQVDAPMFDDSNPQDPVEPTPNHQPAPATSHTIPDLPTSDSPLSITTTSLPPPARPTSPSPLPNANATSNPISPPPSTLSTLTSPPTLHSDIRSPSALPPLPISPSPAPSPSTPEFSSAIRSIRAPRVSLANRLKGVITRAGSVDRETEPMLSPPLPLAPEPRRSIEGLRRSLEGERPVGLESKGVEGLEGVQRTQTPPPVPSKEAATESNVLEPKEEPPVALTEAAPLIPATEPPVSAGIAHQSDCSPISAAVPDAASENTVPEEGEAVTLESREAE